MEFTSMKYSGTTLALAALLASAPGSATTIGDDINLKISPASGGMAGVGYVRPQDAAASVFGNPATLTQLEGGTDFTFGATYVNVSNKAEFDPAYGGGGGDIEMENYLLPSIAVRQRVSDKLVLGTGLQVVSGLGADYRSTSPVDPTVTFMTFGANVAAAYDLSPKTTVGASMTLAYSILEIGLVSNTGIQETFGVRAGLGITHDLGLVKLGLNYNSQLGLDYDDVIQSSPGVYSDLKLEQPREVILGIASTPELWSDLLLEANLIYKNWEGSELYEDIWKDTYTLQLGGQYSLNKKLKLRAGYSYTSDLLKENDLGTSLGEVTSISGAGPITPQTIEFIQASLADPFWNHSVTVGLGYDLNDTVSVDVHGAYGFGSDQTIGANKIEVGIFSVGGGLTWKF